MPSGGKIRFTKGDFTFKFPDACEFKPQTYYCISILLIDRNMKTLKKMYLTKDTLLFLQHFYPMFP